MKTLKVEIDDIELEEIVLEKEIKSFKEKMQELVARIDLLDHLIVERKIHEN